MTRTRTHYSARRPWTFAALPAAAAIAALTVAGCADDGGSEDTGAAATPTVCERVTDLKEHTAEMSGLTSASTVTEIEDVREDMKDDLQKVREAAEDSGDGMDTTRLQQAFDRLDTTITNLDDDTMKGETALDQVRPPLATLNKAIADFERTAAC
ncbi:hypothetical protein ACFYV5_32395 [Streptomyces sp. NPDC003035]|uniref:hypothetical protein n=1 Tax=Streptomyces sp. NPDC003035 TaxID=3364676 RepID=UPI00367AB2D7